MRIDWLLRSALAGIVAWALSLLTVTLLVSGYALVLGFQARGKPDTDRIAAFTGAFAPGVMLGTTALFCFLAGRWAARGRLEARAIIGLVIGAAAALPPLVRTLATGDAPGPVHLLYFAVAAGVAVLGASSARRGRAGQ